MSKDPIAQQTGVLPGRYTNSPVDSGVVFLIGMRFNALHRVDKWWPVFTAMPKMLSYLTQRPEVGMLSYDMWAGRTTLALTYWESSQHLHDFASDPAAPHLAPWRKFMRQVGADGTVGIWHETYEFAAGGFETLYGNMPAFGLGKAVGLRPVGPGLATARRRMSQAPSSAASG